MNAFTLSALLYSLLSTLLPDSSSESIYMYKKMYFRVTKPFLFSFSGSSKISPIRVFRLSSPTRKPWKTIPMRIPAVAIYRRTRRLNYRLERERTVISILAIPMVTNQRRDGNVDLDDEKWKPNMENIQKSIDVQTRVTEINQLIEKVGSLGYDIRTLCLAVSLMDRVLSAKSVSMDKIQLLLLVCSLIAAKYQGFTPRSEDFITALHNGEKVVTMEEEVLDCLQFDVWTPTAMAFVGKYITAAQMNDESVLRCYQLIKLTLLDHICIKFKPSIVAASVVYVAKFLMNPAKHPWCSDA